MDPTSGFWLSFLMTTAVTSSTVPHHAPWQLEQRSSDMPHQLSGPTLAPPQQEPHALVLFCAAVQQYQNLGCVCTVVDDDSFNSFKCFVLSATDATLVLAAPVVLVVARWHLATKSSQQLVCVMHSASH
jgi:hypothetical protein